MTPETRELLWAFAQGEGIVELGLRDAVYAVVRCIPCGMVCSYGDVARLVGRPRAPRQVGQALAALTPEHEVPWWRVIRSDGSLASSGDPVRPLRQRSQLRTEGVTVANDRVDMRCFRWSPVVSGGPS